MGNSAITILDKVCITIRAILGIHSLLEAVLVVRVNIVRIALHTNVKVFAGLAMIKRVTYNFYLKNNSTQSQS